MKAQDLKELQQLAAQMSPVTEQLRNKDAIFLIGYTGAGKSTVLDYLLEVPLQPFTDDGRIARIDIDSERLIADRKYAEIGHRLESCTSIPSLYFTKDEEELLFVDTNGFGDTHGAAQNAFSYLAAKMAMSSAGRVRGIIMVLSAKDYESSRGRVWREALHQLHSLICSDDGTDRRRFFRDSILVVVTHAEERSIENIKWWLEELRDRQEESVLNGGEEAAREVLKVCKLLLSDEIFPNIVLFRPFQVDPNGPLSVTAGDDGQCRSLVLNFFAYHCDAFIPHSALGFRIEDLFADYTRLMVAVAESYLAKLHGLRELLERISCDAETLGTLDNQATRVGKEFESEMENLNSCARLMSYGSREARDAGQEKYEQRQSVLLNKYKPRLEEIGQRADECLKRVDGYAKSMDAVQDSMVAEASNYEMVTYFNALCSGFRHERIADFIAERDGNSRLFERIKELWEAINRYRWTTIERDTWMLEMMERVGHLFVKDWTLFIKSYRLRRRQPQSDKPRPNAKETNVENA